MRLIGQMDAWNLKRKITFFLTLVMLVTAIFTMLISTISAAYYITKQSKDMAKSQLDTLVSYYDDTLEQYQNLAVALVIEDSVQQYCRSTDNAGPAYMLEARNVYNFLINMLNVRSNLNFAVVEKQSTEENGTGRYVYKGNSSVVDARFDEVYHMDYQQSFPVKEGSLVRMSFGEQYFRNGEYTLTLYHPIYSTSTPDEEKGMLIMNFNDSLIDQLRREEMQKMQSELLLMDCSGKIASIANEKRIGKKVSYAEHIKNSEGSFQQEGMLINYQKVGKWNCYLIHEIPLFELYKGSIVVMVLMLAVTLGITIFSIWFLRRMINSFYEPMNQVVLAMDDVEEGTLEERIDLKNMDVDSRKLAEGFNSMMDRIDALVEQVKLEQHQMEQIRFNALQAQIKPHFLYNTLECIHWQAVVDGNDEIDVMVRAMAQFYRLCLSKGKEVIALRDELEHVRSYLIIQNMRYDNIIDLEEQIPESFYQMMIPKMTLQPLVENSIYHGIRAKKSGKGRIVLKIRREEEDVYLSLCDNGTGMTKDVIDEMNRSISEYDETFGYGVRNVNRRIELIFGKEYGLYYFRNEYCGVTVEIHLPFRNEGEEEGGCRCTSC